MHPRSETTRQDETNLALPAGEDATPRAPQKGKTHSKRRGRPRGDLYQEVTEKIISQLEAGIVPWAQP